MSDLSTHLNDALGTSGLGTSVNGQLLAYLAARESTEIAYAENVSTTAQTIAGTTGATGTAVNLTGLTITVPANTRPVWIEGAYTAIQSVAGQGEALILLIETTSGSDVLVEQAHITLPNNAAVRGRALTNRVRVRVGVSGSQRTFKLQARCDSVAANTPSFSVLHLAAARSFLHAWAE